ncbi:MAG: hypothetical protein ACTSP4_12330 [Candidatus Hodarchaeales archaeon]
MPNVLIRDIDPEIYARFKDKAAASGLKLGEALTKAMSEWINSQKSLNEKDLQRIRNLAVYRKLKKSFEEDCRRKWILIARGELLKTSDTLESVLEEIRKLNLLGEYCYVFQAGRQHSKRNFGFGRRLSR